MPAVSQLRVYVNAGHDFFTWSNQKRFMDNVMSNMSGSASGAQVQYLLSFAVVSTFSIGSLLF